MVSSNYFHKLQWQKPADWQVAECLEDGGGDWDDNYAEGGGGQDRGATQWGLVTHFTPTTF